MYDAIVVGARCAGSPTAMLLARKGHRVLLVDRDQFPSDIFRAHVVRFPGAQALKRWGLLDRVLATGCPPILRYTTDFDDFPLSGFPPLPDDQPREIAPRRKVLDAILVNAAVEAGAELREKVVVDDLVWDDDRVVGVRGRSGGRPFEERASIVVGADGQHSLVARQAGPTIRQSTPPLTFGYYTYWAGMPVDGIELIHRIEAGRVLIVFPTNDDLTCIAVQGRPDDYATFRADIEGEYLRAIDLADDLAARVRAGRRAERFQGTADLPNFIRVATGPGWALVGDAGYHRDPLLAHGISDAFRDATLLSEAIDSGLTGQTPLDDALAGYEQQHAEAAMAGFEMTLQACALRPFPPELLRLREAVRGNQAAIDRFYGEQFGAVPPEEHVGQ
jgi:2-polyprenyl-6-methoxyphenol hydroxylase-like FAD-dependent oxidoreductase